MSEREKGPGPTLPEMPSEAWGFVTTYEDGDRSYYYTANREQAFRVHAGQYGASEVAHFIRADLAPDPEREKLVADVLADALGAAMAWRQGDGVTQERRLEDLDLSTRRLEAHDAKGEAGT